VVDPTVSRIISIKDLAPLMAARRKALRLTQQDVADAIGISRRSVHAIEHGKPTAEVETVLRICAALGLIIEARS